MTPLEIWLMILVTGVVASASFDDHQPGLGAALLVLALVATLVVLRLWNYR